MNRVGYALPVLAIALLPLSVGAAPSPSPSLAQVLVAPPSGFVQITAATLHGRFSAETFGTTYGTQAGTAANTLTHYGFVDGYGMTWYQAATGHALVEFVIAFAGGKGATSWLLYEQASDKNEKHYQHDDSLPGIDPYYGIHLIDSSVMVVGDAFSFVKGNDMFGIGFLSTKDDVLDLAKSQAKNQYDSAPSQTISPAQWPENAGAGPPQGFPVTAAILIITAAAIGLLAILLLRMRRGTAVPATSSGPPAQAAPVAAPLQLSSDGNMWWDGQSWRSSSLEPPPFAQRSDDGRYWWDGRAWREVGPDR